MQFIAEAFNLLNHTIITGVNSTYSTYFGSGATSAGVTCDTGVQGCIIPFQGTGTSVFGNRSATNNTLYGPRQMQFVAKLFF